MVTLQDIADRVGSSRGTVSQVLAGKAKGARISDALCAKIREAADELGYRRDDFASALITGRSNVSALLIPDAYNEYSDRLLRGMMDEGEEAGHFIKVLRYREGMTAGSIADVCVRQRLNGVVAYNLAGNAFTGELRKLLAGHGISLIFSAGSNSPEAGICVRSDNYSGGGLAFRHLYELGHRRFLLFANYQDCQWAALRAAGFRDAARAAGVPERDLRVIRAAGPLLHDDAPLLKPEALRGMFRETGAPTALFAMNDSTALNLMNRLACAGIRVPEEVSVIGYGNSSFTRSSFPALCSVEEHLEEIGRICVRMILAGGKSAGFPQMVSPEVIAAASVASIS